jgi:hypothetical protein
VSYLPEEIKTQRGGNENELGENFKIQDSEFITAEFV